MKLNTQMWSCNATMDLVLSYMDVEEIQIDQKFYLKLINRQLR